MNIKNAKVRIQSVLPSNKNDMYNTSLYWSKKPFNIADILIQELSDENDIIFDPFSGSGVTTLQAVTKQNKRNSISVDLNELPNFIASYPLQLRNIPDIEPIIKNFESFFSFINHLYETECVRCGNTGIIQKSSFNLIDRKEISEDVEIWYKCNCSKKTLRKKASSLDLFNMVKEYNSTKLKTNKFIPNSKIAAYSEEGVIDLFTNRNFFILDKIIEYKQTQDSSDADLINYMLTSTLHLMKITDSHSNSQWPIWIPKVNCIEKNPYPVLIRKANQIRRMHKYVCENYSEDTLVSSFSELEGGKALFITKATQKLTLDDIPKESVDLIITDPPFLGQVTYSEYMQLYEPFTGLKKNIVDEVIVSSNVLKPKTIDDYFELLDQSFKTSLSKLKTSKLMCLYFHEGKLDIWVRLLKMLNKNNMMFITQTHIHKKKTLKNIISPKSSLSGDALLFFRKESTPITQPTTIEKIETIELNVLRQIEAIITSHDGATTSQIYDLGTMEVLILNGWLERFATKYKTIVDFLNLYFFWDSSQGKWKNKRTDR